MPPRSADRRPLAAGAAALAMATGTLAQSPSMPTVRVAFAAAIVRTQVPALAEFCERHLPTLVGALPPTGFGIEWNGTTLRQFAAHVPLPAGVVAAGSCRFGDGAPLLWSTAADGLEDWFLPTDFAAPPEWILLLRAADATDLDTPITLSTAVLTAHLAGACTEGDPRAALLQLVAADCGDVTWLAWREPTGLRVRGRSAGGLALPAALTLLANAEPRTHARQALRAFSSRDAHQPESARQLLHSDRHESVPVLRALLRADDDTALAAIDTLVRLRATDELPRIIAAATPTRPGTSLAAVHAVQMLWGAATPLVRQRARGAIARSASTDLRSIDPGALPGEQPSPLPAEPTIDGRGRALLWLSLSAFGLCGMWLRERQSSGGLPA